MLQSHVTVFPVTLLHGTTFNQAKFTILVIETYSTYRNKWLNKEWVTMKLAYSDS